MSMTTAERLRQLSESDARNAASIARFTLICVADAAPHALICTTSQEMREKLDHRCAAAPDTWQALGEFTDGLTGYAALADRIILAP